VQSPVSHDQVDGAALERTRTHQQNTGSDAHSADGGNHSGNIEPNSDQYAVFCERLKASGFTGVQMKLIGDALRESGLQIVASDPTNA
jgi:hypothetical protein